MAQIGTGSSDLLKSQLLTMSMFSGSNGNGNVNGNGNTNTGNNGMLMAIYGIIMMTLLENIVKAIPIVYAKIEKIVKDYIKNKTEKSLDNFINTSITKTVKSKISFERSYTSDSSVSDIADSILDYACKKDNALALKFRNNFFISNKEEFSLSNNISFKLENIKRGEKGEIELITFNVFSYDLGLSELREWIQEITVRFQEEKRNELGTSRFFFDEIPINVPKEMDGGYRLEMAPKNLSFTLSKFETTKSLSNLYGNHVQVVKSRVNHFLHNPDWFKKNGVPYTLGILLYGKPGCGKTSLIKAIAKDTKRHIINLQLRETTTKSQLKQLFYSNIININENGTNKTYYIPTDERIYVIEDIDCLTDIVLSRELINSNKCIENVSNTGSCNSSSNSGNDYTNRNFTNSITSNSIDNSNNSSDSNSSSIEEIYKNLEAEKEGESSLDEMYTIDDPNKSNSQLDALFEPLRPQEVSSNIPSQVKSTNENNKSNYRIHENLYKMNESHTISGNGINYVNEFHGNESNVYDNGNRSNGSSNRSSNKGKKKDNEIDISGEKINLSFLLNILDGVLETPGRILIMTSNYPERLDSALTRPGRVDLKIEFTSCDKEMVNEMFHAFYDLPQNTYNFDFINNDLLRPCELQEILNEHYNSADKAYSKVESFFKV